MLLVDAESDQRATIEREMDGTVGTWLAEWGAKLDGLARRAATEQRVRAERPGAAMVQGYLDELFTDDLSSRTSRPSSVDRLLERLDGHAKSVVRASYKLFQGMSVEDARAELYQLRYLSAEQLEKHFASAEGMLTSAEHAKQVRANLERMDAVEAVLPIAVGLAEYVVGEFQERRSDRRNAELRSQLRRRADEIANEIVAGGSGGQTWSAAVAALRADLTDANLSRDVVGRSTERQTALVDAVQRLTQLLGQAQIPR